ncbi:MAG TPA: hypothetical protein PKO15_04590 [Fibrobacteria bacterium]|nr:hypothetical protein [Fibrobacteria bacterium]HOX50017.1 hypothetical protein [Fibrobacteria bacterium]
MSETPNDRPLPGAPPGDDPDPRIFLYVDGQRFHRPSLETFYARPEGGQDGSKRSSPTSCSCNTVSGSYCSCNKVCTCNSVASGSSGSSSSESREEESHGHRPSCSCVGYSSGGGHRVCSCVPVH